MIPCSPSHQEDPEVIAARAAKKAKTGSGSSRNGLSPFAVLFLLMAIAVGIYISSQR